MQRAFTLHDFGAAIAKQIPPGYPEDVEAAGSPSLLILTPEASIDLLGRATLERLRNAIDYALEVTKP